jgi:adenosylcobinamide-GDP ribazoletransferase
MREVGRFLDAVRFLTRLPVPAADQIEPDWLARSARYFPLVGVLVGLVSAGALLLASELWTGVLPALLAVTASILVTGALHEDGFADTADGFGGGRTTEQRLTIMKDSRLGAYGALALGLGTALRVAALASMPVYAAAAALIGAHAGSRLAAAVVMHAYSYAGDPTARRIAHASDRLRAAELVLAVVVSVAALMPLLLITVPGSLVAAATGGLLALGIARLARQLIGGYTGDVLGAAEQSFEIGFFLGAATILSR